MLAQAERRPAPVLVILMILGIVTLMLFTQGEGSGALVPQEIAITSPAYTAAPSSVPVTPAAQQTLAQAQAETQIQEQRATQTAIAEQQAWHAQVATAAVVQANTVVCATAAAQQLAGEWQAAQIEKERMLATAAVFMAGGAAVVLILLALGLVIRESLESQRKASEAAQAQAEQERLLIEARRRLVEAKPQQVSRLAAQAAKQLDNKREPLPPNGKCQTKDWMKTPEAEERGSKLPTMG